MNLDCAEVLYMRLITEVELLVGENPKTSCFIAQSNVDEVAEVLVATRWDSEDREYFYSARGSIMENMNWIEGSKGESSKLTSAKQSKKDKKADEFDSYESLVKEAGKSFRYH